MSIQVQDSSIKSNIKQRSQVESFSEDAQAGSLSVSAIENKVVLKEGGKKHTVNIKEEKVTQVPEEVSIIVNDSDNGTINLESELKSASEKEPVVELRLPGNLRRNDAEEKKNSTIQKRIYDGTQDKSLSEDASVLSLNISSQISQVDLEDGDKIKNLQSQVN